jgi:hypothetical protein
MFKVFAIVVVILWAIVFILFFSFGVSVWVIDQLLRWTPISGRALARKPTHRLLTGLDRCKLPG